MNVKLNETKPDKYKECTIRGILINIYLEASATNTPLLPTAIVKSAISFKLTLHRNKQQHIIVQNNLEILGLYCSLNYGFYDWHRGNIQRYAGVGVTEQRIYSLFIDIGGVINAKEGDVLVPECTVAADAFNSTVNGGVSFVQYNPEFGVGYEEFTPKIVSEVVQANENTQGFSIGDNCMKLAYLNLNLDNIQNQAIVNASLRSDQLGASWNFMDIFNRHRNVLTAPTVKYRYGNTQPVTAGTEAFPYLPEYPQSFILWASPDGNINLDNCQLSLELRSANIQASMNYVVSTIGYTSVRLLERAKARQVKHLNEKLATMPTK